MSASGSPRAARVKRVVEEMRAEKISVHFEGVKAVDGVDLILRRGEIFGLIGPNGAGKTTLVNALSGFQRPTAGRAFLGDQDVTGLAPNKLGQMGLTRTFQSVRLFGDLTAFENVEAGAVNVGISRQEARDLVWKLLARVQLTDKADQRAASLPYGDERKLGLIRALATNPSFLLLDEPAAGLNEEESDQLILAIAGIRDDFGCGVLVIEHDMRLIMRLCERIQVLDYGKTISEGTPMEVRADPAVIEAYLGSKTVAATEGGHAHS
jgi:branched-chain amino acid transport system ATP-binding protein